ncbi:uncharacterized protein DEA37_0012197, partial [Paragonimus westermani]
EYRVVSLHSCANASKAPSKRPLETWLLSKAPPSGMHLEFTGTLHGQNFQEFPEWPLVLMLDTITRSTISQPRKMFNRFGYPTTLVDDHGTQSTSSASADFRHQNGTEHIQSPPHHPQSNRQVGHFVNMFKRGPQKHQGERETVGVLETFPVSYQVTTSPRTIDRLQLTEVLIGWKTQLSVDSIQPTVAVPGSKGGTMKADSVNGTVPNGDHLTSARLPWPGFIVTVLPIGPWVEFAEGWERSVLKSKTDRMSRYFMLTSFSPQVSFDNHRAGRMCRRIS